MTSPFRGPLMDEIDNGGPTEIEVVASMVALAFIAVCVLLWLGWV